jgi:hypothetical protein
VFRIEAGSELVLNITEEHRVVAAVLDPAGMECAHVTGVIAHLLDRLT